MNRQESFRPRLASGPVAWGVLGCARIARENVIPAMLRTPGAVFAALASRDGEKRTDSRARFGDSHRLYAEYEDLLRDPAIEAVYIPLPNSAHAEWTIRALAAGKHVLCEKPLALTVAEAGRMIAAAQASGTRLMEAFMYRYTHRLRLVEEILRSGELGEIRSVQATFRFLLTNPASIKLRPELGGGALYDVGCYPVNFIGWVADHAAGVGAGMARPESVTAQAVFTGGVDVSTQALLRYPGGLLAGLQCGIAAQRRIHAEVVGTDGALEIPDAFLDDAGSLVLHRGMERREIPVPASDRYQAEIADFSAAIAEGRPPRLPLAESLRNAQVMDRLREGLGA